MKRTATIFSLFLAFILSSCSKKDTTTTTPDTGEFPAAVTGIISQAQINSLRNVGMTIYSGDTPPDVSGIYVVSPYTLTSPYYKNDPWQAGHVFGDTKFQLYNQSGGSINVNWKDVNNSYVKSGLSGVVTGKDNHFTIFNRAYNDAYNGVSFTALSVISGTITANGIENFQIGFIVASKDGDVSNTAWVPIGATRLWTDADNNSPTTTTY